MSNPLSSAPPWLSRQILPSCQHFILSSAANRDTMERWSTQRCQTLLNIHIFQRINSYFVVFFCYSVRFYSPVAEQCSKVVSRGNFLVFQERKKESIPKKYDAIMLKSCKIQIILSQLIWYLFLQIFSIIKSYYHHLFRYVYLYISVNCSSLIVFFLKIVIMHRYMSLKCFLSENYNNRKQMY